MGSDIEVEELINVGCGIVRNSRWWYCVVCRLIRGIGKRSGRCVMEVGLVRIVVEGGFCI